jgi:hypothetical protein
MGVIGVRFALTGNGDCRRTDRSACATLELEARNGRARARPPILRMVSRYFPSTFTSNVWVLVLPAASWTVNV